jgi:adenylate cyclase
VVEREDGVSSGVVDAAALEAVGLYDPAAPNAVDRLALLEHLLERGARIPDLVAALGNDGLSSYSGELVRGRGRSRLTPEEVARGAGVPVDAVLAVSRAAGLPRYDPDEPVYREDDIETFRIFAAGVEVFGEAATLEFTRAMGAALARIADAAMATFGNNLASDLGEASELEQARVIETASSLLVTQVPKALDTLFFHHVEAAVRREVALGGTMQNPRVAPLAVAFLDLVGSTPAVVGMTPEDVASAIGEFERQAIDSVVAHGGRVVKMIGDEVMFVAPDITGACLASLELREQVARNSILRELRGGLAFGGLARGYGDFYGADVNVAARLVKLAEPGVLLVTDAVRERMGDGAGVRFEPAGERRLRGFAEPFAVYALERA